ncbi:D-alanine--D-alanine ligase [Candidatus Saccharibacteria bacterium]|nr:D-alanine--D-alanine ligase [Candidatus Saccharibacteria bacterium]
MSKKTVAVFFGGRSTEHDISIITAVGSVIKPLELSGRFNVVPVYIAKDGKWYSDDKFKDITIFQSKAVDDYCAKSKPLTISFDDGFILKKSGLTNKDIAVDVAFPAMHGPYGEDGSLMGLLRMAGVPYVGCDMQSSVVAMDKILSKIVAKNAGLDVVPDVTFNREDYAGNKEKIIIDIETKLKYPVFVKPPHLGSSIGVTKVDNRGALENAIEVSLHYDENCLVEMAVPNLREATLPIIGFGDDIIPAKLEEPLFKSDEYFDFETKYMQGGKKGGKKGGGKRGAQGYSNIPANFPTELYDRSQAVALAGYKAAGCSGIARVDILINEKTGKVYFNEINPLPGSLYVHNWRVAGISSIDLVCKLVDFALERFELDSKTETTFSSGFLQQF